MKTLNNTDEIQPNWWTQKQVCSYCNIDPKTFRKWGLEPIAAYGNARYYESTDVFKKREDLVIQSRLVKGESGEFIDLQEEQARKTQQERIKLQLANAKTMREQVPVELLTFALDQGISQMVTSLDGIILSIKREIPDVPMSILGVIDREIIKARNNMAESKIDWNALDS